MRESLFLIEKKNHSVRCARCKIIYRSLSVKLCIKKKKKKRIFTLTPDTLGNRARVSKRVRFCVYGYKYKVKTCTRSVSSGFK